VGGFPEGVAVLAEAAPREAGNNMKRIFKHLVYPQWRVRHAFPKSTMTAIERVISDSESRHTGELRFAVEGGMGIAHLIRGMSSRDRAIEVFSRLRVWDTEHNSGVLVYIQLADRKVEIIADRGINDKVGNATWQHICHAMQEAFRLGRFEEGAFTGISAISRLLVEHFPAEGENPDELSNEPVVL
jgi:hypothetical protein